MAEIRLIFEPTVIPIAKMNFCDDGLKELVSFYKQYDPDCGLLDPQDLWPHSELVSDNELLVEMCGRSCYRSFGKKAGRKTNASYISNLMGKPGKIPHACYDDKTEVLTRDHGWVPISEASLLNMAVATRTPNGKLQYRYPKKHFAYDYQGKMYRVDTPNVDLMVTPNHNMLVNFTSTLKGRQRLADDYVLVQADEIGDRSHTYVKDVDWENDYPCELNAAVLPLLGFAIGDGRIKEIGYQVEFHLKKQRKIDWLRNAVSMVAGYSLSETRGDRYALNVPHSDMPLFRQIYDDNREKVIPRDFRILSKRNSLALLDGLLASDGSEDPRTGSLSYSSTSESLLDQVQQLLLHCGYVGHIRTTNACLTISVMKKNYRPEFNRGSSLPKPTWIDEWAGKVYCLEVPNNTLYVRRNGIPVWCGNSVTYHAKMTFFFAGISRRVSHELIRHYVGADRTEEGSPSQESTRFTHHPGWFTVHPEDAEDPNRLAI